jgi:hypothetical protein
MKRVGEIPQIQDYMNQKWLSNDINLLFN